MKAILIALICVGAVSLANCSITINETTIVNNESSINIQNISEKLQKQELKNKTKTINEREFLDGSEDDNIVDYCETSNWACSPVTANLLVGREDKLTVTSTCGLQKKEVYCITSHMELWKKKCFYCHSTPSTFNKPGLNHQIEHIVTRYSDGAKRIGPNNVRTWWQSENGVENVSLRFDLETIMNVNHLILTFKTFRPAAMLMEYSADFGNSWTIAHYWAKNCTESFPGVPVKTFSPRWWSEDIKLSVPSCDSRYSSVAPSTEGEIFFSTRRELNQILEVTNIRFNFSKLHTFGENSTDNTTKMKYYYALYDVMVLGSCLCNGHASICLPMPGVKYTSGLAHYGACRCAHNTKGIHCEECDDFYQDVPWTARTLHSSTPSTTGKECKKCHCNNHATKCHFDANIYEKSGNVSGGVCDECEHNTMGRHCELCKPFFYRDEDKDISHIGACQPCDCSPEGSINGLCDSRTDIEKGTVAGQCHCKVNFTGRQCDLPQ